MSKSNKKKKTNKQDIPINSSKIWFIGQLLVFSSILFPTNQICQMSFSNKIIVSKKSSGEEEEEEEEEEK